MQENGMSARMLDVLMRGISTRQYAEVLPQMASTCGVSRSDACRRATQAREAALKQLLERRLHDVPLPVTYIGGMAMSPHSGMSAVGAAAAGHKHVVGI